jgi:hypothetical protein
MAKTKKIGSGESLPASDFAYVGDPSKTSTWKFPIHDKSHVQNAVARFNQTDLSGSAKATAKRKIRAAYKKFFPSNELPDVIKSVDSDVEKNTDNDKRSIISSAIRSEYPEVYPYLMDTDDSYVYFEIYTDEGYKTFRVNYTYSGVSAEITGNPEEVVRLTEYRVVEEENDLTTEKGLLNFFNKHFGGTNDSGKTVIKQFKEEEMIAIEKLYIHPDDVDGVGDTISLEDTVAMVNSLNKAIKSETLQHGLFHKHKTDAFSVVKAWVAEEDCTIGETDIREGQPLIEVKFHNETAWELRKSGELAGISIGAKATEIEELTDV